jgi:hypothetical protein
MIIHLGDNVHCDFCNGGAESKGGVMIGSHAVCGICTERGGYLKDSYEYADEISLKFSQDKTFKENVLAYRNETTGTTRGTIEVRTWDDFEEVN